MTLLKPYLIIIKSILFYFFDSLALCKTPSPQKNRLDVVILIRQDAIGDFVMWLDTAKEYRKLYPPEKYKIVLVGNKIWCDLAEELSYWDRVIPVDVKQFKTFSSYRWKLLRQILNLKANVAIQPTFSREFYNGDSLIRASQSSRKVSSAGDMANRNWLKQFLADRWHTELIPASEEPVSELERNTEFFSFFSRKTYHCEYPKLSLPMTMLPQNPGVGFFYVLVPGASANLRKWPPEFFAKLAEKIFNIQVGTV